MTYKARAIAFYLPQYHPIPENDKWWGKGFTEWANVRKAKPLFKGHYQPHVPGELGYYDLRNPETREAQAALAKQYGIYGFCYYHYWFHGKRLLEQPVDQVLATGKPNLPFCFCWANENWTRTWCGGEKDILMEQTYSEQDHLEHIRWLATAFKNPKYIRIQGKPLMLIYRTAKIPNVKSMAALWREEARRLGCGDLYLCRVESFNELEDPSKIGFDAAVEFPPFQNCQIKRRHNGEIWKFLRRFNLSERAYADHGIHDYAEIIKMALSRNPMSYKRFPGIMPSWDNSPRRKKAATIFKDATPALYGKWLEEIIRKFTPYGPEEDLIFINAWNEWGEGNHLEPDQKYGRAYLEATRCAMAACNESELKGRRFTS